MEDITPYDLTRGKKLAIGAVAAPLALPIIPAVVTFLLLVLALSGGPAAAVVLFVGVIATVIAFIVGLIVSGVLVHRRSVWTKDMRERMAAHGIKAEQIGWFRSELRPHEKRTLKAVEARDLLLADAYRETLASRLTATRIIKSSKRELLYAQKRQNSLKQLKSARSDEFQTEIARDVVKIGSINEEAKQMLAEAESRLQMIEAAASREGSLADSQLALKKLSARTAELPLALESARIAQEIRQELERESEPPA